MTNDQIPMTNNKVLVTNNIGHWCLVIEASLHQPCLCLCRAFLHTTYVRLLRRTIPQFSQILLTLVRTFMASLPNLYAHRPGPMRYLRNASPGCNPCPT